MLKFAKPEEFKYKVAFLHIAVGISLSVTLIVNEHALLILPDSSATV